MYGVCNVIQDELFDQRIDSFAPTEEKILSSTLQFDLLYCSQVGPGEGQSQITWLTALLLLFNIYTKEVGFDLVKVQKT